MKCKRDGCENPAIPYSGRGRVPLYCSKKCGQIARRKDSEAERLYKLRNKYGLTVEQLDELLESQDGKCAICGVSGPDAARWNNLVVDHDHTCCPGKKTCGKCVRGLLCSNCNCAIGLLGDNPETLMSAVAYLLTANTERKISND